MSSTPFRAAFCALGLAFAMSVLLIVPNPNKIRTALRAHRQKPVMAIDQQLLASKQKAIEEPASADEPNIPAETESTPVIAASTPTAEPKPVPEVAPNPAKRPIQIASANPAASLGLEAPELPLPAPEPVPAKPVPELKTAELPSLPPLEIASSAKPVPAPVPQNLSMNIESPAVESPVSIPVPDPIQQTSRSLVPPSTAALAVDPPNPEELKSNAEAKKKADALKEHGAEIHPGSTPRTWNFQFEQTPLPVVLRILGDQAGSSILVDPEVSGTFSGRFIDADPAQVLAMVVKAHRFSVSRRGAYMLIGIRDDYRGNR